MKSLIEKAEEIVSQDNIFYKKTKIINGIKFDFYNYSISYYKDFEEFDAYFLRGFSVINDNIVSLSLHKFFNINENEYCMIDKFNLISGKYNFYEKYDGSLIIPFTLNDNIIRYRTKGDYNPFFENLVKSCVTKEQEENIRNSLNNNIYPLYEIVSPFNNIVVNYKDTKLVLLGHYDLRDSNNLDKKVLDFIPNEDIMLDKSEIKDKYNELEIIENFEGYVIQDINTHTLYKIKAKKYLEEHRTKDSLMNKFYILKYVINDNIDDILSNIYNNKELLDYVNNSIKIISSQLKSDSIEIETILEEDFSLDKKSFALKYKTHELFSLLIHIFVNKNYDNIIDEIKKFYAKNDSSIKRYLSRIQNFPDFKFKIN